MTHKKFRRQGMNFEDKEEMQKINKDGERPLFLMPYE